MTASERIKRGKFTFTVTEFRPGVWIAGAEASRGSTREAAISAHLKHARADMREFDKRSRAQSAAQSKRDAKGPPRCDLVGCSGARMTPTHKATSGHKSAALYAAHKRAGLIR